jgi:hypothetical protein
MTCKIFTTMYILTCNCLISLKSCQFQKLLDNFVAPINEIVLGGGANPSKVFSPFVSIVVIMNTFSMSTTSFLYQVYFHNTTFELDFLISCKKPPTLLDDEI